MPDPFQTEGKTEYRLDVPRQTRVVLEIVDFTPHIPDPPEGKEASIGPLREAAILDMDSFIWVACSEGVAWKCTDDEPLDLDVWIRKPNVSVIDPELTIPLSLKEIRACRTGETINLSNFVNVGGPRLEDNYDSLRAEFERIT